MNVEKIQEKLEQLHMSVYSLAKCTGLPNSTVCEIVRGKNSNPKILTVKKIVDVLGMNLDDLFD